MNARMYGTFARQGDRAYVLVTKEGRHSPYIRPSKPISRRQYVYAVRHEYGSHSDTIYFRQLAHAQGWLQAIS